MIDGKPAQVFGLFYEGRLVLFYSYECDLGNGWEDQRITTIRMLSDKKHWRWALIWLFFVLRQDDFFKIEKIVSRSFQKTKAFEQTAILWSITVAWRVSIGMDVAVISEQNRVYKALEFRYTSTWFGSSHCTYALWSELLRWFPKWSPRAQTYAAMDGIIFYSAIGQPLANDVIVFMLFVSLAFKYRGLFCGGSGLYFWN